MAFDFRDLGKEQGRSSNPDCSAILWLVGEEDAEVRERAKKQRLAGIAE